MINRKHFRAIPLTESKLLNLGESYEEQPALATYRLKLDGMEYILVLFYVYRSARLQGMYNIRMVINYKQEKCNYIESIAYYTSEIQSTDTIIKTCEEGLNLVKYMFTHRSGFEDLGYPWRFEYGL